MNWEIFWAMSILLLYNTLESQYFTWDFLSVFTAIYSHYGNVLTSLQDQANGIVTENLYMTLSCVYSPERSITYLASWLFSYRWQLILIHNHNFYHHIPSKRNLWWMKHALNLKFYFSFFLVLLDLTAFSHCFSHYVDLDDKIQHWLLEHLHVSSNLTFSIARS